MITVSKCSKPTMALEFGNPVADFGSDHSGLHLPPSCGKFPIFGEDEANHCIRSRCPSKCSIGHTYGVLFRVANSHEIPATPGTSARVELAVTLVTFSHGQMRTLGSDSRPQSHGRWSIAWTTVESTTWTTMHVGEESIQKARRQETRCSVFGYGVPTKLMGATKYRG